MSKPIEKQSVEEIMKNEKRILILEIIRNNQGIRYSDIKRSMKDIPLGILTWHLKVLEIKNIIKSKKLSEYKKYFTIDYDGELWHTELTKKQISILENIIKNDGMTQKQIEKKMDIPQSTISRQLTKIFLLGYVLKEYPPRYPMNPAIYRYTGKSFKGE